MKQKLLLIIFILLFAINNTFANNTNSLYQNYIDNVKNHCFQYYNKDKIVYKYKDSTFQKYYPSVDQLKENNKVKYLFEWDKQLFPIKAIKEIYRDIQNEIYKCGLISAQYNWINILLASIKLDKTWLLKTLAEKKYKNKQDKLLKQFKNCNLKKNDLKITKKRILDQSTFELCKYSYYLDYLYNYYDNIENVLGINNKNPKIKNEINKIEYDPNLISSLQNIEKNEIKNEKTHSFLVFSIAFRAYSEYQNYYPIHLSLELLKDNLILYREKLYKTLNPISQLVYKIINAMSK